MDLIQKYGRTALIAGASEGIGAAFAYYLAAQGMDLILIARRFQLLEQVAELLKNKYKVNVTCIPCDLADPDAVRQILAAIDSTELSILVYNAAQSYIGPFTGNSAENNSRITRLNMITPLDMVYYVGEKMLAKMRGAVILMTSLAGFQGSGFLTLYAATKAFNRILAESLWYEWKDKGVDVIACCAGATATPGYLNSNPGKSGLFVPLVQSPEEVVKECFRKLGRQPSLITGRGNRFASFIMQKILPRKLAITIMGDTTRRMYRL